MVKVSPLEEMNGIFNLNNFIIIWRLLLKELYHLILKGIDEVYNGRSCPGTKSISRMQAEEVNELQIESFLRQKWS